MNIFSEPKPEKAASTTNTGFKVVLLRRKELGNNCKFIADAFPGMKIVMPNEIPSDAKVVIRWGTTTSIPASAVGKRTVLNHADAIHETVNKGKFRSLLAAKGLGPRTWLSINALQAEKEVAEKVIVRPLQHERSEGIYLCTSLAELKAAITKIKGDYYISEYIPKDRELRFFVVSGKIIMGFEKQPKNKKDVSWGCVEQGALTYIKWSQWPLNAAKVAIESFNLSHLDFGAVDVIMKDDKAYALEINTAPEVWPYYGECFAKAFKYIIQNGTERLKVKNWDDWQDLKHPAITLN